MSSFTLFLGKIKITGDFKGSHKNRQSFQEQWGNESYSCKLKGEKKKKKKSLNGGQEDIPYRIVQEKPMPWLWHLSSYQPEELDLESPLIKLALQRLAKHEIFRFLTLKNITIKYKYGWQRER